MKSKHLRAIFTAIKAHPRLKTGLLIVAFYTLFTLIFLPQNFLFNRASAQPISKYEVILRVAVPSYLWAALTPLVFWLGRRFPVERSKVVRNLALHFIFAIVVPLIRLLAALLIIQPLKQPSNVLGNYTEIIRYYRGNPARLVTDITNGFGLYLGILAFGYAIDYFRKYREREFRLREAQLRIFKMQLHPHFLFNTLNAISALIYTEPKTADRTIARLSELLRLSLLSGKTQEVSLKEELAFIRKYVDIQQMLLNERLKVCWKIDPDTLDACVPHMILQPLVENSIRHGFSQLERGGHVMVSARRIGETLRLIVRDNGMGIPPDELASVSEGVGLANTRARLKSLYGESHQFKLSEPPGGGLEVSLTMPFREQAMESEAENL